MRKSILAVFAAAAAAFSCSEQEKVQTPVLVNSTVEVTLGSPATKAFADGTTEEWEKTAHNIAMFVYESGQATCAYQRQFTAYEIGKGKAVFAIPNVKANTAYDFYAVANCDFATEMGAYDNDDPAGTGISRTDLEAYIEGTTSGATTAVYGSLDSYNKADVSGAADWTAITTSVLRDKAGTKDGNTGFIMTGKESATTAAAGSNVPTRVKVALGRTVAKVAIVAGTTDVFATKYPGSTLTVKSAKLTKLAEKTTLITPATWAVANLGDATTLSQVPNVVPPTGADTAKFRNLFYIYENSDGATAPSDANFADYKPVLELETEFDFDGDAATTDDISKVIYKIALAGEAGNPDMTQPLPADFGLFKRNGQYLVNISINGLTENEVVASIDIKDWETLKRQDVNIGDKN